ncbi:MAG: type II toxin-antitoxin system VapC family toxin [Acidobacteria bacterium]|mgnify:CR=1 FL=1|nr:type II toxin-antitoxin system VapC family toxin [Acidobacteriota bacterium]
MTSAFLDGSGVWYAIGGLRALVDARRVLGGQFTVKGNDAVKAAVAALPAENMFISVLSLAEITKGIPLLDDGPRKRELAAWLQALEEHHTDRILPLDLDTAHIWGELVAAAQKIGKVLPAVDGLIAATALRHGLHVMTRNVDDFSATGVLLLNPWDSPNG